MRTLVSFVGAIPQCATKAEYEVWKKARGRERVPFCIDCTPKFHAEARSRGECDNPHLVFNWRGEPVVFEQTPRPGRPRNTSSKSDREASEARGESKVPEGCAGPRRGAARAAATFDRGGCAV